jgi:hypothetical protein
MNFQQALCHVETRSAHSLAGCGSDRSTVLIRPPQASCTLVRLLRVAFTSSAEAHLWPKPSRSPLVIVHE